jgi:hypothetical protein
MCSFCTKSMLVSMTSSDSRVTPVLDGCHVLRMVATAATPGSNGTTTAMRVSAAADVMSSGRSRPE